MSDKKILGADATAVAFAGSIEPSELSHAERVRDRDRYVGAIRRLFPNAGWREIDFMLWNMTAWPVCGNSYAIKQLAEIRTECGPDSKHGWWRKVCRMARRIDAEISREARRYAQLRDEAESGTGNQATPPSLGSVPSAAQKDL